MKDYIKNIESIYGEMNGLRGVKNKYYSLKRLVNEMLVILNKARSDEKDTVISQELLTAFSSLSQTSNKEVEFVKYHEDRMRPKSSANKREQEYYDALDKAVRQTYQDIALLLIK